MPGDQAAVWIAPEDETDRGNVLGAANVVGERNGRTVSEVVEGGALEAAVTAGQSTGLLIVPAVHQVMHEAEVLGLLERAQGEDWRLLLLDSGADSDGWSGEIIARHLRRVAALPASIPDIPVAPPHLRRRVGARGESQFRRSGFMHLREYSQALAAEGADLAAASTVLDWGSGPGRMTAHLLHQAPQAKVTAVDTDAGAIAWLAENLAVARAHAIPVKPPTHFSPDAFDVVIGHSVFSHLDVEAQDAWLGELARVTRPGGSLAVSVNGATALTWHREHPLVDVPASVEEQARADGVAVWTEDGWDELFYPGYHTTFHTPDYIRDHWSRWFDVLSIHDGAATPGQDIVVMRGRGDRT